MDLAGLVLALHIVFVIGAFFVASTVHLAFHMMPRAQTMRELRPWAALLHRVEPLLPGLAVLVLAMGAWLVHLEHAPGAGGVGWSTGWVLTGLVTLIVVEALAGTQLAPRVKAMCHWINESAPDSPVPADMRAQMTDRTLWSVGHTATFGFAGVVVVMTMKPAGDVAWLFVVVAVAIGNALVVPQLRAVRRAIAAAGEAAVPAQRPGAEQSREVTA